LRRRYPDTRARFHNLCHSISFVCTGGQAVPTFATVGDYLPEFLFHSRTSDFVITLVLRKCTETMILPFADNAGNLLTTAIFIGVVYHRISTIAQTARRLCPITY
jgi:hypothetical protein